MKKGRSSWAGRRCPMENARQPGHLHHQHLVRKEPRHGEVWPLVGLLCRGTK